MSSVTLLGEKNPDDVRVLSFKSFSYNPSKTDKIQSRIPLQVFSVTSPLGNLQNSLSKTLKQRMSAPGEAYLRRAAWWGRRSGPSW